MTDQRMALLARLEQATSSTEPDVLRTALAWAIEELMEADVTERLGAGPHERTPERTGHRPRLFDTRSHAGALELAIPKLRTGSYFPGWLLEPRRLAERALVAVVQEAYVKGVSTRKVDDLVRAMGASGVSKSEVSRLVGELAEISAAVLNGEPRLARQFDELAGMVRSGDWTLLTVCRPSKCFIYSRVGIYALQNRTVARQMQVEPQAVVVVDHDEHSTAIS